MKNMVVESVKHHLLRAIERRASDGNPWPDVAETLAVVKSPEGILVRWTRPRPGQLAVRREAFSLYAHDGAATDPRLSNESAADHVISKIASALELR